MQASWCCLTLATALHLSYLARRYEGGLSAVADWGATLSGGEAQRLALARVLWHMPAFACLDEATSALDGGNESRCGGCGVLGILQWWLTFCVCCGCGQVLRSSAGKWLYSGNGRFASLYTLSAHV